jgi:hypothetical protein
VQVVLRHAKSRGARMAWLASWQVQLKSAGLVQGVDSAAVRPQESCDEAESG